VRLRTRPARSSHSQPLLSSHSRAIASSGSWSLPLRPVRHCNPAMPPQCWHDYAAGRRGQLRHGTHPWRGLCMHWDARWKFWLGHPGHAAGRPVPNGSCHSCSQSLHLNVRCSAISITPPAIRRTIRRINA